MIRSTIRFISMLIVAVAAVSGMAPFASGAEEKKGRFQPMGLGGGGKMTWPASSPHNPEPPYVTCNMGGFYTSLDNGKTWQMAM